MFNMPFCRSACKAGDACAKPIETALSGPATSIVGASWLTHAKDAFVSDIGGTTTDIVLLKDDKHASHPIGAQIGPYQTGVEAVAMRTTGLGGDREVHLNFDSLDSGINLGLKWVLLISQVANAKPDVIYTALDEQLKNSLAGDNNVRFVSRPTF